MAAMTIGCNEDLTTKILLLSPLKSVLRFKTVSKLWLSIVSSHRFRQIHSSSRRATATGLFMYNQKQKLEFIPLDNQISSMPNIIPFSNPPMIIKSSAGGLLLLSQTQTPRSPNGNFTIERQYFICNPATKEFQPLDDVPQLIKDAEFVNEYLVFDPCKSLHYKVVFRYNYRCNEEPRGSQILVHSPGSEPFCSPETISANFFFTDSIFNPTLFSYDISRVGINRFRFYPRSKGYNVLYLGESRGRVHMVACRGGICLLVYELKRDNDDDWSLKYQVDLPTIQKALPCLFAPFFRELTILSVVVGEEEEDLTVVLAERSYLIAKGSWYFSLIVACNLKTKLCTVLKPFGRIGADGLEQFGCWPTTYEYIPTLACV